MLPVNCFERCAWRFKSCGVLFLKSSLLGKRSSVWNLWEWHEMILWTSIWICPKIIRSEMKNHMTTVLRRSVNNQNTFKASNKHNRREFYCWEIFGRKAFNHYECCIFLFGQRLHKSNNRTFFGLLGKKQQHIQRGTFFRSF